MKKAKDKELDIDILPIIALLMFIGNTPIQNDKSTVVINVGGK